ncbi:MAG TPA: hypothetical protein VF974_02170 [Patescibacteria group bacterium]
MLKSEKNQRGIVIIYEIVIIFIFSVVMLGIISYALYQIKLVNSITRKEQAFQIAEAGANYYQWHLAHFPTDYQDGTGAAGPYVHDFVDKNTQQTIGQYSLVITAPVNGSTIVTIQSTGYTVANPTQTRTVTVRYGIPSLARYAFLTNTDAWIGSTESVSGEFHSNGGIRFDGTGNAPIRSAKVTYTCQPYHGCPGGQTQPGIWGTAPQSTQNFWSFPVPNVDFSGITSNLATIKTGAQSAGIYLPPSNAQGYSLVFNSNNTVSVYKIMSLRATPQAYDVNNVVHNEYLDYGTGAGARVKQGSDYAIPANGLIYIEDRTWVEGTIAGRVLVAAAKLPYNATTAPSILIPNNIVYTAKDGTVALGLLAQKDILVTYYAPTNLEVDAAMIAQNGSAQRYEFVDGSGAPISVLNSITIYGATTSFGVWTWSWGDGVTTYSGYTNTNTVYDTNLLFAPPPSFPLDSSGYQQLNWTSN